MIDLLNIQVTLPKSLSSFDASKSKEGYELIKRIKTYLNEINNDDYFFRNLNFSISISTDDIADRVVSTINGADARVPFTVASMMNDAQALYHFISKCLLKNLLLLENGNILLEQQNGTQKNDPQEGKIKYPEFCVYVNETTRQLLKSDDASFMQNEKFDELMSLMTDGLFYEIGIPIPNLKMQINNGLSDFEFQAQIGDFLLPVDYMIDRFELLTSEKPDEGEFSELKVVPHTNPATNSPAFLLRYSQEEHDKLKKYLQDNSRIFWDFRGYLILKMAGIVREYGASLINTSTLELMLNQTELAFPDLIAAVKEKINVATLLRIMRALLHDRISVSDFTGILESCITIITSIDVDDNKKILFLPEQGYVASLFKGKTLTSLTVNDYVNAARMFLRNAISYKFLRGGNSLIVFLLDSTTIEQELFESPKISDLPVNFRKKMLNAIHEETEATAAPIILTTQTIRNSVQRLLEVEIPQISVLAYQDLSPETSIQPLARISISQND